MMGVENDNNRNESSLHEEKRITTGGRCSMVIYGGSDDGDCNDACKDAGGGGDEYGDEISYDMLAPAPPSPNAALTN